MRKPKVFGGNFGGTHRVILACRSFAEFKRATRIERDYASETGNPEELALALAEPGTVWAKPYRPAGSAWVKRSRYDA